MSDQHRQHVVNPVYPRPASTVLRSLLFIAIAMLLIFVLLPAALVAAAT